jgi:uncharacterized protein YjbJ (UPF0337 family)
MSDDRIAGAAKNIGGKAQEEFGSLTGNKSQEARGKANQVEGAVQDMYGQAKDAASDIAATADDFMRSVVEKQPYTVAVAALALGYILGRMGRH